MCLAIALSLFCGQAVAGTCTVPGSHDTIQVALDDPACTSVQLSNQSYFELIEIDRAVDLAGPVSGSAEVTGQVVVSGGSAISALSNFQVTSGCTDGALRVTGGARVTGTALRVVRNGGTPCTVGFIFSDGFEQ